MTQADVCKKIRQKTRIPGANASARLALLPVLAIELASPSFCLVPKSTMQYKTFYDI